MASTCCASSGLVSLRKSRRDQTLHAGSFSSGDEGGGVDAVPGDQGYGGQINRHETKVIRLMEHNPATDAMNQSASLRHRLGHDMRLGHRPQSCADDDG